MTRYRFRHSEQGYQEAWLTKTSDKPIHEWVVDWYSHEFHIYDSDNCGDETIEFVVENLQTGTRQLLAVTHEWWWEQGDEGMNLENLFYYQLVESVNFRYPEIDRDWMILKA